MHKLLKALHVLGSAGVLGALAACLVLNARAQALPWEQTGPLRADIAALVRLVLLPSLAASLVSGLLATAINTLYHEARWVWIKAGLGLAIFEGTLFSVGAGARRAAELTHAPGLDPQGAGELARVVLTQTRGLWLLLAVALASTLLAIWRPRLRRTPVAKERTS